MISVNLSIEYENQIEAGIKLESIVRQINEGYTCGEGWSIEELEDF